jgi:hypothetical protein
MGGNDVNKKGGPAQSPPSYTYEEYLTAIEKDGQIL